MKKLIIIALSVLVLSCLTSRPQIEPLAKPVENVELGYSYQSPIDPGDLKTWEIVESVVLGMHPFYGVMTDEYRSNPDPDGAFLYVDMFYIQACPILGGLISYCLVDLNLCLHVYKYDQDSEAYVPSYDADALNEFKNDIDEKFGIETVIPKES